MCHDICYSDMADSDMADREMLKWWNAWKEPF